MSSIFIKRSDWLLLAFVNEESFYCLNAYSHGRPYLWTYKELLKVLDRNWLELIEKYRLKDVRGLGEKLNDKEYWNLRKANMTVLVDLGEGKICGLIGGGYASDGSSLLAVEAADN